MHTLRRMWHQLILFSLTLFAADNVKVTPDGALLTIVAAEAANHGAYRCVASNPFGITHTIVSLIVKGESDPQES